jgi:trehalose 2-sulfotransferase
MPSSRTLYVPKLRHNDHTAQIQKYFGKLERAEAVLPENAKFIFLCFTNRCGSNHVAELLASDGKLPRAGENLNYDTVIDLSRLNSLKTFQEYFSYLFTRLAYDGRFTLKVAPAHLELLNQTGILEQIIDRSHFILVERSDKLGQAISHLIAFQTGRFTSKMAGDATKEPTFNYNSLRLIIEGIAEDHKQFSLFFGHNGITPVHIVYEQLIQFPLRCFAAMAGGIGMPGLQLKQEKLSLKRQSGPLNEEWRRRYLDYLEATATP